MSQQQTAELLLRSQGRLAADGQPHLNTNLFGILQNFTIIFDSKVLFFIKIQQSDKI